MQNNTIHPVTKKLLDCWQMVHELQSIDPEFHERIEQTKVDIKAGEWQLALEFMRDAIYEFDVPINKYLYSELQTMSEYLGFKPSFMESIKYLVIKE